MSERRKRRAYTFWIRRGAGVCGWSIRGRNRGRVAIYLSDHGLFSSQVILRCRKATQPRGHLCLAFDWGNRGNRINQRFSLFFYPTPSSEVSVLRFQLHTYWSGFSLTTIPEWDGEINNKKDARALFFYKKKTSPLPGPPASCPNTFLKWYDDTRVGIVPKLLNGELIIKSE